MRNLIPHLIEEIIFRVTARELEKCKRFVKRVKMITKMQPSLGVNKLHFLWNISLFYMKENTNQLLTTLVNAITFLI